MKFVIEVNQASRATWWLVDDEDRVLAWAGTTFFNLAYADEAAHEFRINADEPEFRIIADAGGRWSWAALCSAGTSVAVSGRSFSSQDKAYDAARHVQLQACTAIGP